MEICEKCHQAIVIGSWPFCPHDKVATRHVGFTPYFDEHLDRSFTSIGEKVKHMDKNNIVPADLKSKVAVGRLFLDLKGK